MTMWHGFGSILLGTLTRSVLIGGSRMAFLDDMLTSVPLRLRVVRAIAQIASRERRRDWGERTCKPRFQTRLQAPAQNSRLEITMQSRGDKVPFGWGTNVRGTCISALVLNRIARINSGDHWLEIGDVNKALFALVTVDPLEDPTRRTSTLAICVHSVARRVLFALHEQLLPHHSDCTSTTLIELPAAYLSFFKTPFSCSGYLLLSRHDGFSRRLRGGRPAERRAAIRTVGIESR
jgi:hypothetical protein